MLTYSLLKYNSSDTDSVSTTYSNRPSYMEKFEYINKIVMDLEKKCK